MMSTVLLEEITKEYVEGLVREKVAEIRELEYKRELPPTATDGQKKELLKDISSFANATGGLILFGIEEEIQNGKKTGRPKRVVGLHGLSLDQEVLRLENVIRTGLDPRLTPPPQFKVIDGAAGGPVLALRVNRSWSAPHMIRTDDSRFWTSGSAGKQPLDVREIRAAFVGAAERLDKIRRFRDERLGLIVANDGPIRLVEGPKAVLHAFPLSMAYGAEFAAPEVAEKAKEIGPFGYGGGDFRFNFDGYLQYFWEEGQQSGTMYSQYFRSGAVEGVRSRIDTRDADKNRGIAAGIFQPDLCKALSRYLEFQKALKIEPPVFVLLTLLGMKGLTVWGGKRWETHFIERDVLLFPEVVVEDMDAKPEDLMKTSFDILWQSAGYRECPDPRG